MTAHALAAALHRHAQPVPRDDRANAPDQLRDAAVLIALTDRTEPGVILTQRPLWLRDHGGQIAFPGGKIEADDADPVAAALREAGEELALPAAAATVIGATPAYIAASGFRITPVLAVVPPDLPLVPDPGEVADWFEIPFTLLFDPARYTAHQAEWRGALRHYHRTEWQGRQIWGVTAGIVLALAHGVRAAATP